MPLAILPPMLIHIDMQTCTDSCNLSVLRYVCPQHTNQVNMKTVPVLCGHWLLIFTSPPCLSDGVPLLPLDSFSLCRSVICVCRQPSKHVNVGPTWVSHGLQGYRVGMGSKWASYLGPTWVTQLGPTWVNPGGHLIWGPLG